MAEDSSNNLGLSIEVKEDRLEIHAPMDVRVIQRQTNDWRDGVTVIFEKRRAGVL